MVRRMVVFFLIVTGLLAGGSSDAAAASFNHTYPGFSFQAPPDWTATVQNGRIVVQAEDVAAFVLIQPVFNEQWDTAEVLLTGLPFTHTDLFAQASVADITRLNTQPDEQMARLTFRSGSEPGQGLALASVDGVNAMLYAVGAPAALFENYRGTLLGVLSSFRFTGAAAESQNAGSIVFEQWTDPNEKAFSLNVPQGWTVQGGLIRASAIDPRQGVQIMSPDQTLYIQLGDTTIPSFINPSDSLAFMGFTEGTTYNPGYGSADMLILTYRSGPQFAQWYVETVFSTTCQNFSVESVAERPDLVQAFYPVANATPVYGMQTEMTGGEVTFTCNVDGTPVRGYYYAVIFAIQDRASGSLFWNVMGLGGYITTPENELIARSVLSEAIGSFRVDLNWAQRQSETTMAVSQIITETNNQISQIISSSYASQQQTLDEVYDDQSDMMLGLTDVVDPNTGETWTVEAGHNYYWRRGDALAGTDTYTRPDIDFTALETF